MNSATGDGHLTVVMDTKYCPISVEYYAAQSSTSYERKPQTCCNMRLYKERAKVTSDVQLITGLLCITMNFVAAVVNTNWLWIIGSGWWSGSVILIAGCLAQSSMDTGNGCSIIGTVFFSSLSCVLTLCMMVHSVAIIVMDIICGYPFQLQPCTNDDMVARVADMVFALTWTGFSVTSLVASIYTTTYCFRVTWYR